MKREQTGRSRVFAAGRATILLFAIVSGASMASDIEEPKYEVVQTFGDVEIRHYEPSIQAQTVLQSDGETSGGFRRLAGFIFGGNDRDQEIAMTAPVQETLEQKAPVMAFTMPSEYAMSDLPQPNDSSVTLTEVPARTVAVIEFSGWATASSVAKRKEALLSTLKEQQIETMGKPFLNQYNPPWTLPFLRRNEVAVEIPAGFDAKQPSSPDAA
ncbi:MAG: heme-binding protein [Pseudomonadota bacterium]